MNKRDPFYRKWDEQLRHLFPAFQDFQEWANARGFYPGSKFRVGKPLRYQPDSLDNLACYHSSWSKEPLYTVWNGIKARCYTPTKDSYKYYGEKGVAMSKSWLLYYPAFRLWALFNGWEPGMHVTRRGDKGDYSAENCEIKTAKENIVEGNLRRWGSANPPRWDFVRAYS